MKKLIIYILLMMSGSGLMAQQDALFSQYMFNMLVINPGYAGSSDALNVTLVNRQQWAGLEGAPQTSTFSIHAPLRNENIGVGLYAYSDVLGPSKSIGVLASYAYKVRLGNGKLSFGVQFGVKSEHIDWNMLDMKDSDASYMETNKNNVNLDANFGIYYSTDNYYLGISSKQLLEKNIGVAEYGDELTYSKLLRHFYGMAGMTFPISNSVVLKPSTLVKYINNAPVQVDLNANFLINDVLWLGASYRTEGTVVLMTEVLINRSLRIGYSYDMFVNKLNITNRGSHEIMLSYELPVFNKRMKTVRYF